MRQGYFGVVISQPQPQRSLLTVHDMKMLCCGHFVMLSDDVPVLLRPDGIVTEDVVQLEIGALSETKMKSKGPWRVLEAMILSSQCSASLYVILMLFDAQLSLAGWAATFAATFVAATKMFSLPASYITESRDEVFPTLRARWRKFSRSTQTAKFVSRASQPNVAFFRPLKSAPLLHPTVSTALTHHLSLPPHRRGRHHRGSEFFTVGREIRSPIMNAHEIDNKMPEVMAGGGPTNLVWKWQGHSIRYNVCAARGGDGFLDGIKVDAPKVLLVHGFGANADHWRKNIQSLAEEGMHVYAVDLLGFGWSSKPPPVWMTGIPGTEVHRDETSAHKLGSPYVMENWAAQLGDFVVEVMGGGPAVLACNSVGCLPATLLAVERPELVDGLVLLDPTLRGLHVRKTPVWQLPAVRTVQRVLRDTPAGRFFFDNLATPETLKTVLREAYGGKDRHGAVDDELIGALLGPGKQPGAREVFLDFISYSGGPLLEDLLPRCTRPVRFGWGTRDPWEDVDKGFALYGKHPCVESFVRLEGLGHCPHDERPDLVNPLIVGFVRGRQQSATIGAKSE